MGHRLIGWADEDGKGVAGVRRLLIENEDFEPRREMCTVSKE